MQSAGCFESLRNLDAEWMFWRAWVRKDKHVKFHPCGGEMKIRYAVRLRTFETGDGAARERWCLDLTRARAKRRRKGRGFARFVMSELKLRPPTKQTSAAEAAP